MGSSIIIELITFYSIMYNFDPNLAKSVSYVESAYKPAALGRHGEYGLFQVRPMNLEPNEMVCDLHENIKSGLRFLNETKLDCIHKGKFNWLVCYNMGKNKAKEVRHPSLFSYVKKVRHQYDKNKIQE